MRDWMAHPDVMPILSPGRHRSPLRGACFMEFASYLAGERWSDHPACTHGTLAHLARMVNDRTSGAGRAQSSAAAASVSAAAAENAIAARIRRGARSAAGARSSAASCRGPSRSCSSCRPYPLWTP